MLSGLDSFAQDPKTGLYSPIISRRQVLPYDDVDALGWGSTPAQITPDLLSAFAVLVGQSGQQGKLINATKYGFLETASQVNYSAKAAGSAIVGATTIRIDDPVFGSSDTPLWIFPSPANPNPTHGPYFVNVESDPHLLDLNTGLLVPVVAGDVVMAVPQVQLLGSSNQVKLITKLIQTAVGVVNPFDADVMATTTINGHRRLATDTERSYDWRLTTEPGAGVQATITTSSFGAGFRSEARFIFGSIENISGAAIALYMEFWEGPVATGTRLLRIPMYVANQATKEFLIEDGHFRSGDNDVFVWRMDRAIANVLGHLTIAGFVEG